MILTVSIFNRSIFFYLVCAHYLLSYVSHENLPMLLQYKT